MLQVGIPIYGTQDFDFTVRGIYRAGGSGGRQPVDAVPLEVRRRAVAFRRDRSAGTSRRSPTPIRRRRSPAAIDQKFANSPYETKTDTEQAFQSSFVSMFGNLNLLLGSIALAVVITTLFVAGNTMAMSVRERTTEIAVMRTLGFPSATIFLLIAGEGLLMSLVGGVARRGAGAA